jgi:hypothetical protein
MSGQPNINPLDQAKFRQQYLANLDLTIGLQQANFNANRIFKKTGVPQQPLDTRSQDEKFQDIQGLKQQARGLLRELMDGQNVQDVLYNITYPELTYLVSAFPQISSILKPKFSLGVPANIFLDFLDRYISAEERNRGVNDGLQQATGDQIVMNTQLILQGMASSADLNQLETRVQQLNMGSVGLRQALLREVKELKDNLPTTQELKDITDIQNDILKADIQQILSNAMRNVPSKSELAQGMARLETAIRTKDTDAVNSALSKLNNLLATSADIGDELQTIKQLIAQTGASLVQGQAELTGAVERRAIFIPSNDLAEQTKDQIISYFRKLLDIPEVAPVMLDIANKSQWTTGTKMELLGLYSAVEPEIRQLTRQGVTQVAQPLLTPESGKKAGKGICGRGVGRPATRNYEGSTRPARSDRITYEDVDWNKGIAVVPRFIPFGRYIINKKRLDDNIVSLKTRAGGYLSNFKSQKVSNKLGKVFRVILGGGIPRYEDIDELTDEEKEYLHKVAKASDIIDRINIPTPNKKEEEQEINQFEIMKGEIMSGNDNADLIKKFKILLIKLSKKNLIPAREGKDILFELTSMGY